MRLHDTKPMCARVNETECLFRARMKKVEDFMNSDEFAAKDGTGLLGLCKSFRSKCSEVLSRGGGRIPK